MITSLCGVVAEFDPFHLGHAFLLSQARRITGCSHVAVIMSACFTQRGAPALLPPRQRAMMALRHGADAVAALPAVWSLRDAEHFALGSVAALQHMECHSICFGSECGDIALLKQAAALLEDPTPMMLAAIHSRLDAGIGYPAALQAAFEAALPQGYGLLASPNDTLAICYLRAIHRLGADITPFCVKRQGGYHDGTIGQGYASATAVRGAILRGDWPSAASAMPDDCAAILHDSVSASRIHRPEALDSALLYRLRTMDTDAWHDLPGVSEGLEDRLRNAARRACSLQELIDLSVTRRYPAARIRRLCCHALLQLDEEKLLQAPLPRHLQLIGFRRDSGIAEHFSRLNPPLAVRAAELPQDPVEDMARDLWALGAGLPAGLRHRDPVAVI